MPRLVGVLLGGEGLVVEALPSSIEVWWSGLPSGRARLVRWLTAVGELAAVMPSIVAAAASEGLVPIPRPRSMRRSRDGRWTVDELAPVVGPLVPPDDLGVYCGLLAPELCLQDPRGAGEPAVVWGLAASLLSTVRWAHGSRDGVTGDHVESPSGRLAVGQVLSKALHDGVKLDDLDDPPRLADSDRVACLGWARRAGLPEEVGEAVAGALGHALRVKPSMRPSLQGFSDRILDAARLAEDVGRPAAPEPTPADPEPTPKRRRERRRVAPPPPRSDDALRARVRKLENDLDDAVSDVEQLRVDLRALQSQRRSGPGWGVVVAMGIGVGGAGVAAGLALQAAQSPVPQVVQVLRVNPEDGTDNRTVDTAGLADVSVDNGRVTLVGEAGVFGPGVVLPGEYEVEAEPVDGEPVDLGRVTLEAGSRLQVVCDAITCRLRGI